MRSCYWAVESACFVRGLMTMLIDDDVLPSVLDARAWLFVDVESFAISGEKQERLISSFRADDENEEGGNLYEEDLARVPVFLLTVVKNVITLPGVRDDLSFVRGVFSMPSLTVVPEATLLAEIRVFTDLLVELGRISTAEQGAMERGFLDFVFNFRRGVESTESAANVSVVKLLRYCSTRGSQNLLRSIFCLDGGVPSCNSYLCDGIGQLSSELTEGVCAVIHGYFSASNIRGYGSVSGPLLEEIMEAHRRIIDLTDLSESMLWDDIGIVAGEEYRFQLYANLGYSVTGERAASPEIGY